MDYELELAARVNEEVLKICVIQSELIKVVRKLRDLQCG